MLFKFHSIRFSIAALLFFTVGLGIFFAGWKLGLFRRLFVHHSQKPQEVSFWVWNRSTPFSDDERSALKERHVESLYWYAGILNLESGHLFWKNHPSIPWAQLNTDCEIIPTIRLEPASGQNLTPQSDHELVSILEQLEADSHAKMIQLDYESTDQKMPAYLDFLRTLKEKGRTWRLSITALGHWHRFVGDFQGLADEIVPMFYDLNPTRETLHDGFLPEMADTATEESFDPWADCSIPWKAALPNFSRLSVVSTTNISRGNIRLWRWDEFWFMPELSPISGTMRGQTRFTVTQPIIVADTPLLAGETLVVRYPDLPVLQNLTGQAVDSGASGIVYFRMAAEEDMSGFDVRDLVPNPSPQQSQEPAFSLKLDGENRLSLTNESEQSLMPVISDSGSRGYALVVDNPQGSWREAIPGDFAKVTTDPQGQNEVTELGLGVTRLYFWFSILRPKQTIHTGLVQSDSTGKFQWQIKNAEPESSWHSQD